MWISTASAPPFIARSAASPYPFTSSYTFSVDTSSGMSLPSADAIAVAAWIGAPAFFAFPSGPAF